MSTQGGDRTESWHASTEPIEVARRHRAAGAELPTQIGPYHILQILGQGAMGMVYLAEQTEPIHRRVALKIMKAGMDSQEMLARFQTEREALALMNHPNVAKVFDAGTTPEGRPYFVMEHVPGVPITDFCDTNRLPTKERLDLFVEVCHAVQHAHQKGIIHRDIKPSNVLVGAVDGRPCAKVIDFGIAKAVQQKLSDQTLSTQMGQILGTPAYMSPEQAGGTPLDIDTRSDVYSLGVLLYELLTGSRPFEDAMLRRAALAEMQRIICEVDPPKPSTRLLEFKTSAAGLTASPVGTVAANRRTQVNTLLRQLRGGLDWIVMKCLEKDRNRRYETVNGLVMEIHRFLNNEPVLAGPPSAVYRLRKFVLRNRAAATACVAVFLALLAGLVTTLRQYRRTEAARKEAVQGQKYAMEMQHAAETRGAESELINRFLVDSFRAIDPAVARGRELTARELLDQAAAKLTAAFPLQPLTKARLHFTIGNTYRALGAAGPAESHLNQALTLRQQQLGEEHILVAETAHDLGALMDDQGRYESAEKFFGEALAVYRKNLGENHSRVLEMRSALGLLSLRSGAYDKAEGVFREVLKELHTIQAPTNPMIIDTMCYLAAALREKGEYEQSESYEREALHMRRSRYGPEHPFVAESLYNLGLLFLYKGDCPSAGEFLREALSLRRKLHGDSHSVIALVLCSLGEVMLCMDSKTEAEKMVREAVGIQKAIGLEDHVNMGLYLCTLGAVLEAKGESAEAEAVLETSVTILKSNLPPEHWSVAHAESLLGESKAATGGVNEAEKLLVDSFTTLKSIRGPNDRFTQQALVRLINYYLVTNQTERADAYRPLLR